ncbi:hypothetical protein [uncultured Brachyspira sp.]|uniref:hypothetical protein n=1 Tax=uncultured Brachyspira sp. TaxID=221953 RepID=UPI00260A65EA|nr:hypothetical protein [uncultured Brachyspira sp.]
MREAVAKGMMMTVSADGISVVYADTGNDKVDTNKQVSVEQIIPAETVKIPNNEVIQNKPNKIVPDNIETVDLEENNDPFAI